MKCEEVVKQIGELFIEHNYGMVSTSDKGIGTVTFIENKGYGKKKMRYSYDTNKQIVGNVMFTNEVDIEFLGKKTVVNLDTIVDIFKMILEEVK